jgi:hypothetical protein
MVLFGEQRYMCCWILLLLAVLLCCVKLFLIIDMLRNIIVTVVTIPVYGLALYKIQSNISLPFSAGRALYFFLALRLSK